MEKTIKNTAIFLITLGISSFYAFANITKDQCLQGVDYSQRMGPVRDQKQNGLCWAFASSALLEEESCMENPSSCGQSLSPLDTSRCEWKLGNGKDQGGVIRYGLNCGLNNGVCAESLAPYNGKVNMNLTCEQPPHFKKEDPAMARWAQCADPQTYEAFQNFLDRFRNMNCMTRTPSALADLLSRSYANPDEASCYEKDYLLSPEARFRKNMLIGKQCRDHRTEFKAKGKLTGKSIEFPGGPEQIRRTSPEEKYASLRKIMESNQRSVGLGVCVNKIPGLEKIYGGEAGCSGHALVINGSRWENGHCQLQVKNSWGEIDQDNPLYGTASGWVDAEKMMNASFEMEYLGKK